MCTSIDHRKVIAVDTMLITPRRSMMTEAWAAEAADLEKRYSLRWLQLRDEHTSVPARQRAAAVAVSVLIFAAMIAAVLAWFLAATTLIRLDGDEPLVSFSNDTPARAWGWWTWVVALLGAAGTTALVTGGLTLCGRVMGRLYTEGDYKRAYEHARRLFVGEFVSEVTRRYGSTSAWPDPIQQVAVRFGVAVRGYRTDSDKWWARFDG